MAAAALVDVNKPLTDQQKLFVHYWAEGDSIPNAMKRAGYNDQPSYGYRMAKMPNILALYAKYKKEYEEAGRMTKKKVMDMHMEAFEMSKLMAEPSTMVAAAREIGRLCGYYEPTKLNVNLNVAGNVTMQSMEKMSDAELIRLIEEGVNLGEDGGSDSPPLLTDESGGE
jgi:uncharacterized protein YunC (DUF1805 family)